MSSGDGKTGPVNIRGVAAIDPTKPPIRLEIRQLKKDPLQWNLYLLALERFQNVDESDPLSYFQIAGIHGHPYDTWPREAWNDGKIQEVQDTGFCTHSSILFLPWHRPYLALFEYALHKHVTDIAEEFQEKEGRTDYIDAAKTFRIPYWDWALPGEDVSSLFPSDALQHQVALVTQPGDKQLSPLDHNPLGTYPFLQSESLPADVLESYDDTFKIPGFDRTVRYAPLKDDSEQDKLMAEALYQFYQEETKPALGKKGKNLTERTLYILQSYNKYKPMSNNGLPKQPKTRFDNYGSMEDIHGAIHNFTGGIGQHTGQMANISLSSFDPIFWLHHCNIDRLFAIWQAVHEDDKDQDTYVTATTADWGTFSTASGDEETPDTDLTPFTNNLDADQPTYWKSKDVKDTKTFGYVYPETQSWKYPTPDAYKQGVINDIKSLYEGGSLANIASAPQARLKSSVAALNLHAETNLLATNGALGSNTLEQATASPPAPAVVESVQAQIPGDRHPKDIIQNNQYLEWLVNIKAEKHALDGQWAIHIFLGDPDDSNPYLYPIAPSYIGTVAAMGQENRTGCAKCKKDQAARLTITGQVPLTIALVERYLSGEIASMERGEIVAYLKKNLHWRVTAGEGVIHDRQRVTGLLVAVVTNKVTVPDNDNDLPIYDEHVVPVPEATSWPENDGTGLSN